MYLIDAVCTLTRRYRDECVYATPEGDRDADSLYEWAADSEDPRSFLLRGNAIFPVYGGRIDDQPVVRLKTMTGWDWETGLMAAQLPAETWPDESAWRAWAVAR